MEMKYTIDELGGFMIFPPYVPHDRAAVLLGGCARAPIVSAGMVKFIKGHPQCYGKSVSLVLASRGEEDAAIIARAYDTTTLEDDAVNEN